MAFPPFFFGDGGIVVDMRHAQIVLNSKHDVYYIADLEIFVHETKKKKTLCLVCCFLPSYDLKRKNLFIFDVKMICLTDVKMPSFMLS